MEEAVLRASGLPDTKPFLLSSCPGGGDNGRLLPREKHLAPVGHRTSESKAHAPRKKKVRDSELPFKNSSQ